MCKPRSFFFLWCELECSSHLKKLNKLNSNLRQLCLCPDGDVFCSHVTVGCFEERPQLCSGALGIRLNTSSSCFDVAMQGLRKTPDDTQAVRRCKGNSSTVFAV